MPNYQGGTRVKRKRTPSPEWQAFQATLLHPDQIAYEVIRPVVTLGQDLTSRAAEVGLAPRTLARKVEQFVQFSIPGLVASSTRKPDDKRLLPPLIRDYILQLKAEHALLTPREIATIVEVRFDRATRLSEWSPVGHSPRSRGAASPSIANYAPRPPAARPFYGCTLRGGALQRSSATCMLHAPPSTIFSSVGRRMRW